MRLPEWFPGVRSHRAHAAAWAPELTRDTEGFTVFARRTEAALVARLTASGVFVVERRIGDERMLGDPLSCWVELVLSDPSLQLYVYGDQIDLIGNGMRLLLEHWDAATPELARQAALAALDRALGDPRPVSGR